MQQETVNCVEKQSEQTMLYNVDIYTDSNSSTYYNIEPSASLSSPPIIIHIMGAALQVWVLLFHTTFLCLMMENASFIFDARLYWFAWLPSCTCNKVHESLRCDVPDCAPKQSVGQSILRASIVVVHTVLRSALFLYTHVWQDLNPKVKCTVGPNSSLFLRQLGNFTEYLPFAIGIPSTCMWEVDRSNNNKMSLHVCPAELLLYGFGLRFA